MVRLCLLRHAPALHDGKLTGRRNVDSDCNQPAALKAAQGVLASFNGATVWSSPARRCVQTCAALGLSPQLNPSLWEQDFGEWDGLPFADLPDLGPLSTERLSTHRPPGGESFLEMGARVQPVLQAASADTVVVAHAGTVRAALAMIVGPAALSFVIAPLSCTLLRRAGDIWSVEAVNIGGVR